MKPSEVISFAKEQGALMVDLRFTDLPGTWQHVTMPISQLTEELFEEGANFDGSSIRGWRSINESDMTMKPDPTTALMDPFTEVPTLVLICDIVQPDTHEPYDRDPRQIAKQATAYLKSSGIADIAYFGPEAEFFIFDDIRYEQNAYTAYYQVDSDEATWNSGRDEQGRNLGHKPRAKEGYFPVMPTDSLHDLRTEICLELEKIGIQVERQHHEVASAGQGEINFKFDELVNAADKLQWFKYIVKNVARRHGKTATFMPKPVFGDNGSGMHVHMSLWKGDQPLFGGDKYAGLSEMALNYIGGILKNAPSLCSLTNPTLNSYKRLVPGFEAPVKLAYSYKNRSAAIRIPNSGSSPKAKRIEFRTPDGAANPYLAFSGLLMAGIDGVLSKEDPGQPLDKDIYGLPPEEAAGIPSVPRTLDEALMNFKTNHEFLLRGEVFSQELTNAIYEYKFEKEIIPAQQRPTPFEFFLYYDV